ncbi:lysophospholipid acyltransferase family protein [Alphaproteobacteria bacterium KMM 3653]|uniref:Lysophospholipid acyltransferase family protein n=1 Tax=Harenicola maris TaxID=2841044 RepID=A0AAP2G2W4_9RHOB|nr:lysophospholipid acyltransferase family protein [Harenicola maris]
MPRSQISRKAKAEVARDISYASSAQSKGGKAFIRLFENATGRLRLIKRAEGYDRDVAEGRDFWQVMTERYGLSLDVVSGSLDYIPKTGPVILIANHPYGILDGMMLGHILSITRGDFRILAHRIFRRAEELNRIILPVDFDGTKEAVKQNLETRKEALSYLAEGGAMGIFPGGTVSTSLKPFSQPMDPGWRTFTSKLVAKSGATVVPIYFHGHNSRLFQLASHLHVTLRMAMLIHEFKNKVDEPVRISIGKPIERAELDARRGDSRAMMDFLRCSTYALSPKPLKSMDYGFEFEEQHKG